MKDSGYMELWGAACIWVQEADTIIVIPKEADNYKILVKHLRERDFYVQFSVSGGQTSTVLIEHVQLHMPNAVELFPKFSVRSMKMGEYDRMEICGDVVDDFFRPASYFFECSRAGKDLNVDFLYHHEVADEWKVTFEKALVKITLSYGDILRYGIASDLKLHPKLTIQFEKTGNLEYIYRLYEMMINFFKMIRYDTKCGKIRVELFGGNGKDSYSHGYLTDFCADKGECLEGFHDVEYSTFKPYIERLLQFSADNLNYSFQHYPNQRTRVWGKDYTVMDYVALFSAFENECHACMEIYETADTAPIQEMKDTLLKKIQEVTQNGLKEEERQFLSNAKSRIGQLGTQLGQKRKIVNAYKVLERALNSSIENIFYLPEFRLKGPLDDKTIHSIAESLTSLRGTVVHGDFSGTFSDLEAQKIRFFEVLIYAQMLKRAGIEEEDIERIIGAVFMCNFKIFEDFLQS